MGVVCAARRRPHRTHAGTHPWARAPDPWSWRQIRRKLQYQIDLCVWRGPQGPTGCWAQERGIYTDMNIPLWHHPRSNTNHTCPCIHTPLSKTKQHAGIYVYFALCADLRRGVSIQTVYVCVCIHTCEPLEGLYIHTTHIHTHTTSTLQNIFV